MCCRQQVSVAYCHRIVEAGGRRKRASKSGRNCRVPTVQPYHRCPCGTSNSATYFRDAALPLFSDHRGAVPAINCTEHRRVRTLGLPFLSINTRTNDTAPRHHVNVIRCSASRVRERPSSLIAASTAPRVLSTEVVANPMPRDKQSGHPKATKQQTPATIAARRKL